MKSAAGNKSSHLNNSMKAQVVTLSLACNSLRITCRASSSENALSIDWRPPGGKRESRKRASEVGGATCKADPALVV
jgi:hypothetical protein